VSRYVSARFYVSKASGLKDMSRDELRDALLADEGLLPQNRTSGFAPDRDPAILEKQEQQPTAQARFLSPSMSPVFVTFSAADMH
jgi:hypothetical protein